MATRLRIRRVPGGRYGKYDSIAHYLLSDPMSPFCDLDNNPDDRVYFIGPDDGPIKIGRSNCVEMRLATLQIGSPAPLKIHAVAMGGHGLERAYHNHFSECRLHGEWFELTNEMRTEIKRHAW